MNVVIRSLEEQQGDIIRPQFRRSVADVHPYPIDDVFAVGFDDELPTRGHGGTEQSPESSLSARMQVHFWLLKEEHPRCLRPGELCDHRQDLAHAVADIDQIAFWAIFSSDLDLKRPSSRSAELIQEYLIKESGRATELLKF